MTDFLFLLVILCNVMVIIIFLNIIYPREGISSPLFFVLLFYMLNYPVRAICLYLSNGTKFEWEFDAFYYGFHLEEIFEALTYSTLFIFLLLTVYIIASQKRNKSNLNNKIHISHNTTDHQSVFTLLFVAYIGVYIYKYVNGDLYGLYYDLNDLKRPFLVNILYLTQSLKWLLLAYWALSYFRCKSHFSLFITLTICATIIFQSIVSTGKGSLVLLVMLFASIYWFEKNKIPKKTILASVFLIITFAYYSYTARNIAYNEVRSTNSSVINNTIQVFNLVYNQFGDLDEFILEKTIPIFNRFNAIDGLILCQKTNSNAHDNIYFAGSIVELGNMIPRIIWPDRPHFSFNHHVTNAVWEENYTFSETPIGRIGESFYVLGWFGLIYSVFYPLLWNWLYDRLLINSQNILKQILFFYFLCIIILPDAYILYNIKEVILILFVYLSINHLNKCTKSKYSMHPFIYQKPKTLQGI